jgi:hypothetical protein
MPNRKVVYFAQAGHTNRVKIGCAVSVLKRLQTLQTGCPEKLRIVLTIQNGSRALEKQLHKRFSKSRITGEWFEYEPEISGYVLESRAERKERFEQESYERRLELEQEEHERKEQEEYEAAELERYENEMYEKYLREQEAEDAEEDC